MSKQVNNKELKEISEFLQEIRKDVTEVGFKYDRADAEQLILRSLVYLEARINLLHDALFTHRL